MHIEELSEMTSTIAGMKFYYCFVMNNGFSYCSDKNRKIPTMDECRNNIWFADIIENDEKWISTYQNEENENIISIARRMLDDNGNFIGLYLFNIYEENFSNTYIKSVNENDIYIIDQNGNIVSHTNHELIGLRFYDMEVMNKMFENDNYNIVKKNQKEYLVSICRNQEFDWILVEEIRMDLLLGEISLIRNRMVLIGILILIAGMVVCTYIAHRTTKPLGELVQELEHVGQAEEEDQKFDVSGWLEINKICDECNYMNKRIRSLVTAIKDSEGKKRMAEMGFMQSQMSPHFLYNTLFSIRCMVDMKDTKKAIGIIDAFTAILKYILSYKSEFVDVSQEVKFLEDYAILQKYRYGDQFELKINCPDALYQKKILRMMLEPLVENSLFHGLDDEKEKICVLVDFSILDNDMIIAVTDNGVGFTDENCIKLNEKIRSEVQSNRIGMNNIRERIKMTFGKKYGLKIDMDYCEGARVIIKIPVLD